jgi:RNAse (barnase) inhibitor barstar
MILIRIDTRRINDWDSFHTEFAKAFGFPDYYGRNMNAWIDCMTYLDDPDVADTIVKAPPDGVVALQLDHASNFHDRRPETL